MCPGHRPHLLDVFWRGCSTLMHHPSTSTALPARSRYQTRLCLRKTCQFRGEGTAKRTAEQADGCPPFEESVLLYLASSRAPGFTERGIVGTGRTVLVSLASRAQRCADSRAAQSRQHFAFGCALVLTTARGGGESPPDSHRYWLSRAWAEDGKPDSQDRRHVRSSEDHPSLRQI